MPDTIATLILFEVEVLPFYPFLNLTKKDNFLSERIEFC